MNKTSLSELITLQKHPLVAALNGCLVDGQVDLTKLSEEQIAQMEADLLMRRNAAQQKLTPP